VKTRFVPNPPSSATVDSRLRTPHVAVMRPWLAASASLLRRSWVTWLVLSSGVTVLGALTAHLPAIGIGACAVVAVIVFPTAGLCVSLAWIVLVRPESTVIHGGTLGFNVSEVDIFITLAVIASFRIARRERSRTSRNERVLILLVWPLYYLLRSLLPQSGAVAFGPPLVDLHLLSAFVLLIPLVVVQRRIGSYFLVKLLTYCAYLTCAIAIVSWALYSLDLLRAGDYAIVNVAAGNSLAVRPGGEVLLPILAALLALDRAPLICKSRLLPFALLSGEILVSQTLSIALACVVGVGVAMLFNWRHTTIAVRTLALLALVVASLIASGTIGVSSRFDLSQRVGEDSAQYRVAEMTTVSHVVYNDVKTTLLGTGPGSLVTFHDPLVDQVKRDTHNVFMNILLKTGAVGLACFVFTFAWVAWKLAIAGNTLSRALSGGFVAIGVLSVTVPFIWTVGGMSALLLLAVIGSSPDELAPPPGATDKAG
jgi:hypothetical protein